MNQSSTFVIVVVILCDFVNLLKNLFVSAATPLAVYLFHLGINWLLPESLLAFQMPPVGLFCFWCCGLFIFIFLLADEFKPLEV